MRTQTAPEEANVLVQTLLREPRRAASVRARRGCQESSKRGSGGHGGHGHTGDTGDTGAAVPAGRGPNASTERHCTAERLLLAQNKDKYVTPLPGSSVH